MICYKDNAFCIQECANKQCDRNMNDKVVADAGEWWGNDSPPIMFSDFKTETCGFI